MKKITIILLIILSLFVFCNKLNASTTVLETINVLEQEIPQFDISTGRMSCSELLGSNLLLVIRFVINSIKIIGVIYSIIMGMTTFLNVVNKGDAGEWNKAVKKCIWIAVVLVIVVMMPTLVKVIGKLFGLDTSCL